MADMIVDKKEKTAHDPIYKKIAKVLREEIKAKYSYNESLPTQRQLAERFNASYLTVNNAVRELVNEGLVTRTVGQGTFVCEQKERSKGLISILMSFDHNYLYQLLNSIKDELNKSGYHPILLGGHADFDEEKHAFDKIGQFKEAGVILYSAYVKKLAPQIKALLDHGVPVVTINRFVEGCDFVEVDHLAIGRLRANYLIEQKCERIHYIYDSTNHVSLQGFLSVMAEENENNSIQLTSINVEVGNAGEQKLHQEIAQITRRVFSKSPYPDALVIEGDRYLETVVRELKTMGVVPGKDVKLVSSDDANIRGIPHVTVKENWDVTGTNAARLLLDRIEGRYTGPPRVHTIAPELVVYE